MSLKSIFAYSFQSFYLAGSFLLLFIFLPSFYNLSLGFALSTLGLIILISRLFDVFSDVYIGYQTEKRVVNGKSKKRQIQFGILVFIFSLIGLYVVQPSNIYLFIFYYNLALISYSIAIIPYDSIVIDQKKISTRRFHLATIKEIFTIIGVICALVFPTVVSKILSVELLSPQVIKLTGIFMIVVSIIGIAIFHFFFDEESQYQSKAVSIKQIKFFIFKNTKVTSLAIITFFNLLANNFTANLFIIFVSTHLGLPDYAGLLLILYFLITLISTPLWYKIGKSYSNMFLLQVGTLITMIGFFPVLLIHSQNWELYIVVIFITGIGIGIDLIIPQIELANILDDNQDNRLSQIFTAFFSIIKKAAIGIAGGISLTGYGYLEKIEFSLNSFIPNIMIFYFFIPIIIKLIVLFLVMRYRSKFDVSAQS
ncbi:MFS transporter [bacterium]|jgi:Na+/melibiose symporter-like transporter|nr:MFS transporter [bacterium]